VGSENYVQKFGRIEANSESGCKRKDNIKIWFGNIRSESADSI
jgi:hypothetical protein